MNYVISTDLFREEILPRIVHSPLLPERVMQPLVAGNHSTFGVFIFDKPWAKPTILHGDTSLTFIDRLMFQTPLGGAFDPEFAEWLGTWIDERYSGMPPDKPQARPKAKPKARSMVSESYAVNDGAKFPTRGNVLAKDEPFICRPPGTGLLGGYHTPW